jgi:hypothetical protein
VDESHRGSAGLGNPVVAFAAFVRQRLAEVSGALAPLLQRSDSTEVTLPGHPDGSARSAARQLAMVIVSAAAPFAPTAHARARLLRQAHASGLLSTDETDQVQRALGA